MEGIPVFQQNLHCLLFLIKTTLMLEITTTQKLSKAWELAQQNVKKAQHHQEQMHDRRTRDIDIKLGDRVFIYMPLAKQCQSHKFARPFHGPYRVIEKHLGNISARPINQPHAPPIRVSLFWPAKGKNSKSTAVESEDSSVRTWSTRLRTRKENNQEDETRTSMHKEGEM